MHTFFILNGVQVLDKSSIDLSRTYLEISDVVCYRLKEKKNEKDVFKKYPSIQTLCSAILGGSSKRVKRTVVEKQSKVKAMSVWLYLCNSNGPITISRFPTNSEKLKCLGAPA